MKVNDFYKNIYSTSSIKALESKFNYLSYDKKININEFLTVRIILSLLIFIVSIYYFNSGYFIAPILTFLFSFLLFLTKARTGFMLLLGETILLIVFISMRSCVAVNIRL